MKKLTIAALAVICAVLPLAARGNGEDRGLFDSLTGSGKIREKEFDFVNFSGISVGYNMQLNVRKASGFSVTLRADDNVIEKIIAEKKGTKLEFRLKPGTNLMNASIEISIEMPELESLDGSGGSRITVEMGATDGNFDLDLSGGARLEGTLSADNFNMNLSGGSTVKLSGSCRNLNLNGSGGAVSDLSGVKTENVSADLSGGSRADVSVSETVSVNASGGAQLNYRGNPSSVKKNLSGGAGVNNR